MIHQLAISFGQWLIQFTSVLGYPGLFLLTAAESMILPVPSEVVMPFAGYLIYLGRFNFPFVFLASAIGSVVGSLISYALGYYGGRPLIIKLGKYFFLTEKDLDRSEKWFMEKGEWTILVGRFVPVIRHLISIPAGIGEMNIPKFCLYTFLGAGIWNTLLAFVGWYLGKNWEQARIFLSYFSWPALVIILILIAWFLWHRRHIFMKKK